MIAGESCLAAKCMGVCPLRSLISVWAWLSSSSSFTHTGSPRSHATCRGVWPDASRVLIWLEVKTWRRHSSQHNKSIYSCLFCFFHQILWYIWINDCHDFFLVIRQKIWSYFLPLDIVMFKTLSEACVNGNVGRTPVRVVADAVHNRLGCLSLQGKRLIEGPKCEGVVGEPVRGILFWCYLKQPVWYTANISKSFHLKKTKTKKPFIGSNKATLTSVLRQGFRGTEVDSPMSGTGCFCTAPSVPPLWAWFCLLQHSLTAAHPWPGKGLQRGLRKPCPAAFLWTA